MVYSEKKVFSEKEFFSEKVNSEKKVFSLKNVFCEMKVFCEKKVFSEKNVFSEKKVFSEMKFYSEKKVFSEQKVFPEYSTRKISVVFKIKTPYGYLYVKIICPFLRDLFLEKTLCSSGRKPPTLRCLNLLLFNEETLYSSVRRLYTLT